MTFVQTLDHQILLWIASNLQSDWLTAVMKFFSMINDRGYLWIGIAIILLLWPGKRQYGVGMLIALGVSALLGEYVIKSLVMRERPFVQYSDLHALIAQPKSYSFPSSHTFASFAAAGVLCFANKYVGIVGLLLAALIGFSRIYLCVHFPSDVLAGIVSGVIVGCLCGFLSRRAGENLHYRRLRKQ